CTFSRYNFLLSELIQPSQGFKRGIAGKIRPVSILKDVIPLALSYARLIAYDKKIFDDYGVAYLSHKPTMDELREKGT
ncbi:unnamed protein product, partial [marine sediment metagenome]